MEGGGHKGTKENQGKRKRKRSSQSSVERQAKSGEAVCLCVLGVKGIEETDSERKAFERK